MVRLNIDDAAAIAISLHRHGELGRAEAIYRQILEVNPGHADVMHFLGLLLHQLGQQEEALSLVRRSVALQPGVADFRMNLGNVLLEQGWLAEAEEAYRSALALDPESPQLHNNLAIVLRGLDRPDQSEMSYRKAVALDPAFAEAHENLGRLLALRGRLAEAIACYARALTLQPNSPHMREHLVRAHGLLGQLDEANAVLQGWLREEPDNPVALHLQAAYSGADIPERASDRFVEATFDRFAASFDSKLESLHYRAPALVAEALRRAIGAGRVVDEALDTGCGTGLSGLALAPLARRLTGVDLSRSMLDQARRRGIYADLVQDELTRYLESRHSAFDAIVSADTLVYFGRLERVLAAASGALRPAGVLAFTLEAHDDGPDHRLNLHGRYSHRQDYVARALEQAGLVPLAIEVCTPRQEAGHPVPGLVATARRGGTRP